MHIFKRLGRLIKTLLLMVVLGTLKLITLSLILFAILLEAIGLFLYNTPVGTWFMQTASAKLADIIVLVEEVILWTIQGHIVANAKFTNLFVKLSKVDEMLANWPKDVEVPKPQPYEIN